MKKTKEPIVDQIESAIAESETLQEVVENIDAPVVKNGRAFVTVCWRGNERVYSHDIHGKDFKKLAEQLAKKLNGIVK